LACSLYSLVTAAHKGLYCNKQYVNLGGVVYQHRQEQPYTLVICEKPAAALRIAEALGTANLKILRLDVQTREKTKRLQTPVFHATDVNGTKFLICSAIGHLYGLVDRRNNRDIYPVFDVKWVPIVRKKGALDTKKATAAKQIISTIAIVHKLNETLLSFKQIEIDIGRQISDAITITRMRQQRQTILGSCPVCIVGQLKVIWSSRTKKRFAACSNYVYAKCKATAPLPQSGSLRTIGKSCPICRWPIVKATYFHRNRSWKFCISIQCPAKKAD
jgi:hypothetical protein